MEETKELQTMYKIFRCLIYLSLIVEFFEYAIDPALLDYWGGIVCDIHSRVKRWFIYMDGNLVWSKIATIVLICITCIGTRNKKHLEFDARRQVFYPLVGGLFVTILSIWLFGHRMDMRFYTITLNIWLYMAASILGTICIHVALDNISKFLKEGLLKDRFNFENESFEQCQELQENKYSINIPMRYYYKGKFRKGWVNIVNPFRGTWVVGTPGSGKTFSIIEPFIRQHSAKGFAMVVYDYKFPTLAQKLYYHYKINQKAGKVPQGCKFNIINFVDVEYSRRVNPIQQKYIGNLAAASETAETLLESLQKGKKEGGGGSDQFFQTSAVNFLAACIYFFVNYKKVPYDKNGNPLIAEMTTEPKTHRPKPTGRVFDHTGREVEPEYWLGKYSDMPHILSFLNLDYQTIFEVLETDPEVAPLLGPFQTAMKNKAMEQLEGMIGTLRVYTSRLATKESAPLTIKDCTYRIYRDTRFSKDKSPYKTHFGAFLAKGGKKSMHAGYYFHIGTGNSREYPHAHMLASGNYCYDKRAVKILREDISDEWETFSTSILGKADAQFVPDMEGALKRVPREYDPSAPYADWMRMRAYCLTAQADDDFLLEDHLAQRVAGLFKTTKPFVDYINRAVDYVNEEMEG